MLAGNSSSGSGSMDEAVSRFRLSLIRVEVGDVGRYSMVRQVRGDTDYCIYCIDSWPGL